MTAFFLTRLPRLDPQRPSTVNRVILSIVIHYLCRQSVIATPTSCHCVHLVWGLFDLVKFGVQFTLVASIRFFRFTIHWCQTSGMGRVIGLIALILWTRGPWRSQPGCRLVIQLLKSHSSSHHCNGELASNTVIRKRWLISDKSLSAFTHWPLTLCWFDHAYRLNRI